MTTLATESTHSAKPCLSIRLLDAAVREVEPGAALLPPWLLQNIIALDLEVGASPLTVPHRKIHVIDRRRLHELAHHDGMPLPDDLPRCDTLVLLAKADSDWLADRSADEVLRYYWRLLFHARIDAELQAKYKSPSFDPLTIEQRIARIGRSGFNEAHFVLKRERYLPHHAGIRDTYAEFMAVYLELNYFQPDLLPVYFPSLKNPGHVLDVFSSDIDAIDLLRRTRPSGAEDSATVSLSDSSFLAETHPLRPHHLQRERAAKDAGRGKSLLERAARAASLGNHVRAAILRTRVFRAVPHDKSPLHASMVDLDILVDRLKEALELSAPVADEWRSALRVLLSHAAGGWWRPEDRLLYDLQKVCVYHERELYSVGVIEWLLEFGRRPLRRPQPTQRRVLMAKALQTAIHRAAKARLSPPQRAKLVHLLHGALHHVEEQLRAQLCPVITESLEAGGLHAHNAVERVAEHKLTEELIDGLTHRGFLTMGNVRDAISRNQIKFDDLKSVRSFIGGGPLLSIDRRLAHTLDGIYHRGEIYLRFFQRVSLLLFATFLGRLITRTILMPVGGAFILLEAFDHTLFLVIRHLTGWHWLILSRLDEFRDMTFGRFVLSNLPFFILVFLLFGCINLQTFRLVTFRALSLIGKTLKVLVFDGPKWILNRPIVLGVLKSRAFRLSLRFGLKPLIIAAIGVWLLPAGTSVAARWIVLVGVFTLVNTALNSRAGRAIEQAAMHWLRVIGARVTNNIFDNVLRGISHFFKRRLEDVDRMLYAVDEWLRFRSGQSGSALVAKASLGAVWFFVAYFTRFAVNLLVEPQINPIKHFPVVTVSHKIVLPNAPLVVSGLETLGISTMRSRTMAAVIVTLIPGIFGFLAWELRANWKLYRANRPKVLKPVSIGSHGESMSRLLRPGFHSGTVPKIFARLRRAHRHFSDARQSAADAHAMAQKQAEAVEHVCEAVANFIERELLALVQSNPSWHDTPVSVAGVTLCVTRIDISIASPHIDPAPALLFFEQRSGWILAGFDNLGWIRHLPSDAVRTLRDALLGLYKIAGVDLIKEQIESLYESTVVDFELSSDELTVWTDAQFQNPRQLDLRKNKLTGDLPDPLLGSLAVTWDQWVSAWQPVSDGTAAFTLHPHIRVLRADVAAGDPK